MSTTPPVAIERYAGPSSPRRSEASSLDNSMESLSQGVGVPRGTRSSTASNPLKYFLQDIGKVPLLTQEEEVILGRQVQKGIKLMGMRAHLKLIRGRDPTNEEWAYALGIDVEQLQKELNRTARAKKAMISANLRLVVNIAKRYRYSSLSLMDLIQEGTFGLVRAVERYDPERGFRFSTYAVWWIKQRIGQGSNDKVGNDRSSPRASVRVTCHPLRNAEYRCPGGIMEPHRQPVIYSGLSDTGNISWESSINHSFEALPLRLHLRKRKTSTPRLPERLSVLISFRLGTAASI